MATHVQCLYIDVVQRVGPLVSHSNDSILAHAVHTEVDGVHLLQSECLGDIEQTAFFFGYHVHTHQHRVVTHKEVIALSSQLVADGDERRRLAPRAVGIGAQHEFALQMVVGHRVRFFASDVLVSH